MFSDPGGEFGETAKDISFSGNQLALTIVNVSQCAESINLQFKDKLVRIERLKAA